MSSVNLQESILALPGYYEIEPDMRELVDRVLARFNEGQVSIKKASKQVQGLFGEHDKEGKVHLIFNALARNMPLDEYIKSTQRSKPLRNGAWSPEEDQLLLESVKKYGTRDWNRVAESVGNGRTKAQCSQRWSRTLDPTISRETWTDKETLNLIKGVEKYGTKAWVKVAKLVGTRSDVQCRYHYKSYITSHQKRDFLRQLKASRSHSHSHHPAPKAVIKETPIPITTPNEFNILLEDDVFDFPKDFLPKDPLSFLDKIEFGEDMSTTLPDCFFVVY